MAEEEKRKILSRSEQDISSAIPQVQQIIEGVRTRGDRALVDYTRQFNGADISGMPLAVQEEEFARAEQQLSPAVKEAIRFCANNVRLYHEGQRPGAMTLDEVMPGVYAGERALPIANVGLYAPRGKGSFPSSTYMMAAPARVAKVPRVVVVTPPDASGACDPATLFAARLCGAHEVYRVGGVQAIAALAYGTESIRRVDKFVGPGNQYVTAAKRLLVGVVDVGLPAGPSESMIVADDGADPHRVALDLLIEAEHGADSQALLVTPAEGLAREVAELLPELASSLPEPRATFVREVFANYGGIILTTDSDEALAIVNDVAPEHLQIATRDPLVTLSGVRNAGEILLGQHTPFSLANYAIGANAVLPTGGKARSYSPLSVRDFLKYSSVAYLTADGHRALRSAAVTLADYEGFPAHAMALRERRMDEAHVGQEK
ncbi:MAG TPA: histidinol dehydrogenase [Spirochaetia bacterium]|nr:histidinol dehydrogenase [Spirochaetia bacterium]